MKRRFLIVSILLAFTIGVVSAADFSWGGGFSSVWAVNMDVDSDYNFSGLQYGFLSTVAKIDDNSSILMVLEFADSGTPYDYDATTGDNTVSGGAAVKVASAVLRTDIFGALSLDLPVTLSMTNGLGRLDIHDRFSGVGTGWDPEIFKANGALDGDYGRYTYTGFDLGVNEKVFIRLYSNPGSWDTHELTILTEVWAPMSFADDLNLDLGGWLVLEDGYALGFAEETIPIEPDGNLWFGFRAKIDKSIDNVDLGFWLGTLLHSTTRYDYTRDGDYQKFDEILEWTFVEAVSVDIKLDTAMNLKLGFWAKEKVNLRFGDTYSEFMEQAKSVQDVDPELSVAVDFILNHKLFLMYGGVLTTDIIVDQDGVNRTNGRWDFGLGYHLGASLVKLGVTGPLITKDIGTAAATLPSNDGLGVCNAVINNSASGSNETYPVLYVTAEVNF